MNHDDSEREYSREELAAIELGAALTGLGPDDDRALMVTLRLPDGAFVKDVWLSTKDVDALTDGCIAIGEHRLCFEAEAAAEPLPLAEDDLTDGDVHDVFSGFASLLGAEDGEL
jgi:hypothetical protein